jgi:Fic family protein
MPVRPQYRSDPEAPGWPRASRRPTGRWAVWPEKVGARENYLHDHSLPPLVHAALVHSQFEAIHSLFGGDGRIGRLLITLEPP